LQPQPNAALKKEPKHVCLDFKQPHQAISKQIITKVNLTQVKPAPF